MPKVLRFAIALSIAITLHQTAVSICKCNTDGSTAHPGAIRDVKNTVTRTVPPGQFENSGKMVKN